MLVLEPGMHRIEIRSGSRKPYLTYVVVQAVSSGASDTTSAPSRAIHLSESAQNGSKRRFRPEADK
jgi:hypothetical protein